MTDKRRIFMELEFDYNELLGNKYPDPFTTTKERDEICNIIRKINEIYPSLSRGNFVIQEEEIRTRTIWEKSIKMGSCTEYGIEFRK